MYRYPDKDDVLTCQLIDNEFDGRYWGESEKFIIKEINDELVKFNEPVKMLDVGCGMGRLFGEFAPYVESIAAVEPDRDRFSASVKEAESFGGKVSVRNGDVSLIGDDEKYSFVLISHILQHIKDESIAQMLDAVTEHLLPGGIVAVTTTHTSEESDLFFKEFSIDGERQSEEIDYDGFNECFSSENVLPVRLFAEDTVKKLFTSRGYSLVNRKYYHYEHHHAVREDLEVNNSDGTRARDIMYIFRKASSDIDINVCYQFTFSYFNDFDIDKIEIDENRIIDNLKKSYEKAVDDESDKALSFELFRQLKTSREFLHGGGLPFRIRRVILPEYEASDEEYKASDGLVYLNIYPEVSVGHLCINMSLKNLNTDQAVYFRHVQGNGRKVFRREDRSLSVHDIFEEVSAALGLNITDIDENYCLEINRFDDYDNRELLINEKADMLYGMMTGDEGYRNVPESLALERLSNRWGSRDFMGVICFGANTLLINLNNKDRYTDYVENRRSFDNRFYGDINPYFLLHSHYAGINHGVNYSIELATVIKCITNRILHNQSKYNASSSLNFGNDIRKTRKARAEMITTLHRIENISISEVGEMERVLINGQQIEPLIDKCKYLLELIESELNILYQAKTNRFINILTICGLAIAIIQVIVAL